MKKLFISLSCFLFLSSFVRGVDVTNQVSNSGSGGTTTNNYTVISTAVIFLETGQGAALYPSTNAYQAISKFESFQDTYTFLSVFSKAGGEISTFPIVCAISLSTGGMTLDQLSSINTSSYTIAMSTDLTRYRNYGVPDTIVTLNAWQTLYLLCVSKETNSLMSSSVSFGIKAVKAP
jgi:hypothetical protein